MDLVFLGFNLYAWITILTVLSMFTVLLLTKLRADLVFLGAIAILFVKIEIGRASCRERV